MKSFKIVKRSIAAALAISCLSMSLFVPKANAVLIVSALSDPYSDHGYGDGYPHHYHHRYYGPAPLLVFTCIVFLPICLLNEKSGDASITPQDLLDNGYEQVTIDQIQKGQDAWISYLSSQDLKVERGGTMTNDQLAIMMKTIPGVTPEYIEFARTNF